MAAEPSSTRIAQCFRLTRWLWGRSWHSSPRPTRNFGLRTANLHSRLLPADHNQLHFHGPLPLTKRLAGSTVPSTIPPERSGWSSQINTSSSLIVTSFVLAVKGLSPVVGSPSRRGTRTFGWPVWRRGDVGRRKGHPCCQVIGNVAASRPSQASTNCSGPTILSTSSFRPISSGAAGERANSTLPCCKTAPRERRWALPATFVSPTNTSPGERRWKQRNGCRLRGKAEGGRLAGDALSIS